MQCQECGAELPTTGACIDRFHALLAAEAHNDELRRMHGLTVLTYYLQHPSLTKPWYQHYGRETMRRIFGQGEDWQAVLLESHPRGVGRQQSAAAIARLKAAGPKTMPDWVVTGPVPGELTVFSVDPEAASGQGGQIMVWARSVAVNRFLERE